jgi:hypothetical protein
MTEPRVLSVALAIERGGLAVVTVTHVFEGTLNRDRTVVYEGNDLALASAVVDAWTAKIARDPLTL